MKNQYEKPMIVTTRVELEEVIAASQSITPPSGEIKEEWGEDIVWGEDFEYYN